MVGECQRSRGDELICIGRVPSEEGGGGVGIQLLNLYWISKLKITSGLCIASDIA